MDNCFDIESMKCRRVIQGNCGWSDQSLLSCHRFFPPRTNTSADKLNYISKYGLHGCIEIDSTTYNIPSPQSVSSWVKATPTGFTFHIKAFGLLCSSSIDKNKLPNDIRQLYSPDSEKKSWITLDNLGDEGKRAIWSRFNAVVDVLYEANKLGYVLFQFHTNFVPSKQSFDYLYQCSSNLKSCYPMAFDFRNRQWVDDEHLDETIALLRSLRPEGVVLVASDDLVSEMHLKDVSTAVCDDRQRLPIVLTSKSCSKAAYIRIHRRVGTHRVLDHQEIQEWSHRVDKLLDEKNDNNASSLQGPIYVLWATDHEDQPIINARNLKTYLKENKIFNCQDAFKLSKASTTSSIQRFFRSPESQSTAQHNSSEQLKDDSSSIKSNIQATKSEGQDVNESVLGKRANGANYESSLPSPKRSTLLSYFKKF